MRRLHLRSSTVAVWSHFPCCYRIFSALAGIVLLTVALAGWARGTSVSDAVALESLPVEARATVELIQRGGPFPHARDGIVFGNRERLLPSRPRGFYREYTVPTPGRQDRGARRIVVGGAREYYWTADHYRSFSRITGVP